MSIKQREYERERLRQEDERILKEMKEEFAKKQAEEAANMENNEDVQLQNQQEEPEDVIAEIFSRNPKDMDEAKRLARVAKAEIRIEREKSKEITKRKIEAVKNEAAENLEKVQAEADEKIEQVKRETEAANDKFIRLMAEFQNYKKRTDKERQEVQDYANEEIMIELLTVLDNFERAFDHDSEDQQFVEGMKLIYKQFYDILVKSGLEEIKAYGEPFDPNYHRGVMRDDNEDFETDIVTEVIQKGYTLNGKVIRPAVVKVNN